MQCVVLHFEKWNCYASYGYKQQTVLAVTVHISGKFSVVHHYKRSVPPIVLSECSVASISKKAMPVKPELTPVTFIWINYVSLLLRHLLWLTVILNVKHHFISIDSHTSLLPLCSVGPIQ